MPFALNVEAEDPFGNVDSSFTGSVTVSLASNASGGTLGGTLTMTAANGVASFSDLTVSNPGSGYTLLANGGGLGKGTSASFDVTTDQLAVTTQTPSIVTTGNGFGLSVSAVDASGNVDTSFNGSVTVSLLNLGTGSPTLGGTLTVQALHGVATFSGLTTDQPGMFALLVTAPGVGGAESNVVSASQAIATTTSLQSSEDPAKFGDTITITATVSGTQAGSGVPTGSVQFLIDGVDFGTPIALVNGSATSGAIPSLGVGNHTVTASFISSDGLFKDSNGTLTDGQIIGKAIVTVAVASSSTSSVYGQALTFTARVSPLTANLPAPSGSIQFEADGNPFGPLVELVNGSATSPSLATLGAGKHTITALYTGDPDFAGLSSTATSQVVSPAPLTIQVANQSKVYGQANPSFSVSTVGLVLGQSVAALDGTLSFTTTATDASHVGSYAVMPGGLTSPNYAITFVPGTVVVTPAPLTVSAVDVTKPYGEPVPMLTADYSGFVNGDVPSSLATPVILTTTATASSTTGLYTITASGASSPDYTITFVAGVLAVPSATTTTTTTTTPILTSSPGWIAFVTTLYKDVLGRAPETFGFDYWLGRLADGTTRAEVNREFFGSAERRMLQKDHKAPKISQKAALADAQLADRLASVPATALTNPGHIALVATLYHEILNRDPEPTGQQYFLEELAIGTAPATVALDIYDSPEHKALQHQHKALRISERTALADALKAEKTAVTIKAVYPAGPMYL